MEILLFVSGSRQIAEAIERVGIKSDTTLTAVLVVLPLTNGYSKVADFLAGIFKGKDDDALLDEWTNYRKREVKRAFRIGSKELEAASRQDEKPGRTIERLITERSALLAIVK